jgi:DNA-binding Lrp family transcriptional regulator
MARSPTPSPRALDPFDRAILAIIQQDNKTHPSADCRGGEPVGGCGATAHRRDGGLRRDRKPQCRGAQHAALGHTITSIVEVTLADERQSTVERARATFLAASEVQQCYYVTGGISFVLVIVTTDMIAYEALTRRLFANNEVVTFYRSLIALDRAKAGMDITIA